MHCRPTVEAHVVVFDLPDLRVPLADIPVLSTADAPRPDCDNLAKAVLDGLQGVMGDDTRVARLAIQKAWGSEGSTTVTIATGFDGEGATS
jgi:Holliday junction resolvase RusA-like endonuclease